MTNPTQQAFVQGIVLDTDTGNIFVYNPLVIDYGTQPAVKPVVPMLPTNNVVALWFGFNGGLLTLLPSTPDSLVQANCVNGILNGDQPDFFGQIAYCNAPNFFQAAFEAISLGKLIVPPLGRGKNGQSCPTVRDFGVVDQDQSDNVVTTYILTPAGTVAQDTRANRAAFPGFVEIDNGSDNFLLSTLIDPALGCKPWKARDLADPGTFKPALPLDELSAMYFQRQPVALVPAGDPMVLTNNGQQNLLKLNAFRVGVGQRPVISLDNANTVLYCQALGTVAPERFESWAPFLISGPSPDPAASANLYGFLVNRFINTWGPNGLNCAELLNLPSPIVAIVDAQGITTGGTIVSHTDLIPDTAFKTGGEFSTCPCHAPKLPKHPKPPCHCGH